MIRPSVQPWKKYDTDPNVSYVLAGRAGTSSSTLQRGSLEERRKGGLGVKRWRERQRKSNKERWIKWEQEGDDECEGAMWKKRQWERYIQRGKRTAAEHSWIWHTHAHTHKPSQPSMLWRVPGDIHRWLCQCFGSFFGLHLWFFKRPTQEILFKCKEPYH